MTKKYGILLITAIAFLISVNLFASQPEIIYLNPKPNSDFNYLDSKITIRFSENIGNLDINKPGLSINGSISGNHSGEFILSDDKRTLIFKTYQTFLPNETITVSISDNLFDGIRIKDAEFKFSTSYSETAFQPLLQRIDDEEIGKPFLKDWTKEDEMLEELPEITFPLNDTSKAYHGYILLNSSEPQGTRNYVMILDYNGNVYKWRKTSPFPFNFRLQPNGQFAYSESISGVATQAIARIIDQDFNLVASYQCGNGFNSFPSEFALLPNGHVLMVALEPMPINMRDISPMGDPNASVLGSVVQELDKNLNVVFQWRSWDYTDIKETYENINMNTFRTLHLNGIDVDTDGNYLFSVRHFAQIMKINRNTGEIMWRLGGKKNDFTFINEHEENAPLFFSYQHEIRRQPNGNITFFDNGNLRTPQYSRALEYKLDEVNKTAELVWEYRNDPDIYAATRGSVQILPNGNYLIGCGSSSTSAKLSAVEVIPTTNEVVMSYVLPQGFESYRTYKIDLPVCPEVANVRLDELMQGNTYIFNKNGQNTGVTIEFKQLETPIPYNSFTVKKFDCSPLNPEFQGSAPQILINKIQFSKTVMNNYTGTVTLDLNGYAKNVNLLSPKAFYRSILDSGVFVELPSVYDNTSKTLVFTVMGTGLGNAEICIGDYFDKQPTTRTKLVSPRDNAPLNNLKDIKFVWSPNGRYDNNTLFIYKQVDTTYELIKQVDSIRNTSYTVKIADLPAADNYAWSVLSGNEYGTGSPSVFNFTLTAPFMTMLSPNGGERLIRDSISYVIKWDDNLDDLVRIELLDGDEVISKIADSLQSQLNNIRWTIPASVPTGTNYRVRVTSVKDNLFEALSHEEFEIISKTTGIDDEELAALYNPILSPNPAKDNLNIAINSPAAETFGLSITDLAGNIVYKDSRELAAGANNFKLDISGLNSGAYIIKFETNKGNFTKKFVKVR